MSLHCTRCEGTGFLNIDQVDENTLKKFDTKGDVEIIKKWIFNNSNHDVCVCDCCGDGERWYDIPGEHYNDDKPGHNGCYGYNGGLCECN